MTITLGAITTGTNLHGTINAKPWEFALTNQSWFGVNGEQILWGGIRGAEAEAWLLFTNYVSHAAIQAAIKSMDDAIGTNGTLTYNVGGDIRNFPNATFFGFYPEEPPWLDGSGVNGWQCRGVLRFRWS